MKDKSLELVSIIIPMHNVSSYIERLLKNILAQNYKNWELILIDDNSSDNTLEKISCVKDKRIKSIRSIGKGVSNARNTGLKYAKGKYVCFIDADDQINNNYIDSLVNTINREHVDIVLSNYYEKFSSTQKLVKLPWVGSYEKEQIVSNIIPKLIYPKKDEMTAWMPVWRTIISKSLIKENGIFFDENIRQAEDFDFMLRLLLSANKVYFSKEANYIYYRFQGSSMNRYIPQFLEMQLYIHKKLINTLKEAQLFSKIKKRYNSNRLSMYSIAISNSVKNPNKKKAMNELKSIRNIVMNDHSIIIWDLYNNYQIKFSYILLKLNLIRLIYIIYSLKEKVRLSKLNG